MSRLVASSAHRTFPKTKTAASSPVTVTVTVKSLRATQEKSIKTTTINAAAARAVKTLTDLQEAVYEEIQRNYQVLAEARAEERILRRLLQGPLYYACNGHVHSHTDPRDPSPWLQDPKGTVCLSTFDLYTDSPNHCYLENVRQRFCTEELKKIKTGSVPFTRIKDLRRQERRRSL
jgi:hypothetical protein